MSRVMQELDRALERLGPDPSERELTDLAVLRIEVGRWLIEQGADGPRHTQAVDVFGPGDGLPEIHRSELDLDRLASGLQFHGAIVVREFMTSGEVDLMRQRLDDKERIAEAWAASGPPDAEAVAELQRLGFPGVPPRAQRELIAIYRRDGFADALQGYLGGPPLMATGRMTLARDLTNGGLPWHQDGAYFLGECGAVASWCALTEVGVTSPGLQLVPRRFHDVVGFDEEALRQLDAAPQLAYSHEFADEVLSSILTETPPIVPVLAAGDALLFDEMTMHRTDQRRFDDPFREKAISWFFAPSRFSPVYIPTVL
jgi:hypothetical protein